MLEKIILKINEIFLRNCCENFYNLKTKLDMEIRNERSKKFGISQVDLNSLVTKLIS